MGIWTWQKSWKSCSRSVSHLWQYWIFIFTQRRKGKPAIYQ